MAAPPIKETEELLDQEPIPHLSHSRINRYLTCSQQYRLYYIEKLRPRIESAGLVFGVVIHAAIADLFRTGEDPVEHFERDWQNLKEVELRYKKRESWEDFNAKGEKLLRSSLPRKLRKSGRPAASSGSSNFRSPRWTPPSSASSTSWGKSKTA